MKYTLTLLIFTAFSCNNKTTLEARAKQYMKDSIVPKFNDPSSYELVSVKVDTLKGSDYISNLKQLYADSSLVTRDTYEEKQKEIATLSATPGYADSVINIHVAVAYRGKNKMGALILDKTNLRYSPIDNKFILLD